MDVVCSERRSGQRNKERPHFCATECVSGFHRGLARHGRREPLVTRESASEPIANERRERVANALLGVEAWMRHRHAMEQYRVPTESLGLETERCEEILILIERLLRLPRDAA